MMDRAERISDLIEQVKARLESVAGRMAEPLTKGAVWMVQADLHLCILQMGDINWELSDAIVGQLEAVA
jgi:division protein CdvB (Snf7/Vps24/ESCRT-III family)